MNGLSEALINRRLMKHLYDHGKKTAFFNFLLAMIVAFYFHLIDKVTVADNYVWLIIMAVLAGARLGISHYAANDNTRLESFAYHIAVSGVLFLTGCLWSWVYFHFYPDMSVFMQMFVLLVISGVSSASTVSMASSPLCYYGFITPIVLAVLTKNTIIGSVESIAVIFVMMTFVGFLVVVFSANRSMLIKNITMEIKQAELIEELKQFNKKLSQVSITDDLTKMANRRHFSERLLADWIRAKRSELSIALILIDVDYFKQFNDNYGHLAGDHCLKQVADIVCQEVHRETDLAARIGGDEMAAILYDTSLDAANSLAKRIVYKLSAAALSHKYSPVADKVTLSIGICARVPKINEDYETLISCADQALYAAKDEGRNIISVY